MELFFVINAANGRPLAERWAKLPGGHMIGGAKKGHGMLRFILRRHMVDGNVGADDVFHFTIDAQLPDVEIALTRGGSGPMGFDHTSLVGVEVIEDAPQEVSGAPGNFAQQGALQNGKGSVGGGS
jgi:hypothetical protein